MVKKSKAKAEVKPVAHFGNKPVHIATISGEKFRQQLEAMEITQSDFARFINVGARSVRAWISGDFPLPRPIAPLVTLMVETKTAPSELKL